MPSPFGNVLGTRSAADTIFDHYSAKFVAARRKLIVLRVKIRIDCMPDIQNDQALLGILFL
jgi:hypothetical protein